MKLSSRFFALLAVFLMTSLVVVSSSHCVADDDPFGDTSDDPFGDPFSGPSPEELKQKEEAERRAKEHRAKLEAVRKEQDVAKLKTQLEAAYQHIESLQDEFDSLREEYRDVREKLERSKQYSAELSESTSRKMRFLESDKQEFESLLSKTRSSQNEFMKRLLSSGEPTIQRVALNYLAQLGGIESQTKARLVEFDQETTTLLDTLADSADEQTRQLARAALVDQSFLARRLGFQPSGGMWLPLSSNPEGKEHFLGPIRQRLNKTIEIDFIEIPLRDALEYIEYDTAIEIRLPEQLAKQHEEQYFTIEAKKITTRAALEEILAEFDLTYRIYDNYVKILPAGDPEAIAKLTYNVRGLLTDEVDIMKLEQLLVNQFAKGGKVEKKLGVEYAEVVIEVVDAQRLVITATEPVQHEVSVFLGSLAR